MANPDQARQRSLRAVEWLNFFLADVQTGLGPFLAAVLASAGWNPARVGYALTFGGLVTVTLQTPAGAAVDGSHRKRFLVAVSLGALVVGATLLLLRTNTPFVYAAQLLIGGAAPFLAPCVAAITLGIVGGLHFDRQFGRNQSFNAAGNVVTALIVAYLSYRFGNRSIFYAAIVLAIPALIALGAIDSHQIDYAQSRGAIAGQEPTQAAGFAALLQDRILILFPITAFLFHLANAAMLPQLGEMLSRNTPRLAAPFMSACVIVTQCVIALSATWVGRRASLSGRKPLLLVAFGVLPLRGVLYTLTHAAGALIAIQILDGVANSIFGIVSILVIKDRTKGTGHFNFVAGVLATSVGIGAALSTAVGGILIQRMGYSASFLGLSTIAAIAFLLLWFAIPETLENPRTTLAYPPLLEK